MPFAALDDGFHANRKMLAIGLAGRGLFASALSYCAHEITDGLVPGVWAKSAVGDDEGLLQTLTTKRAWQPVRPGQTLKCEDRSGNLISIEVDEPSYIIPDYLSYNPSSVEIAERLEAKRKAGRKGAAKRWQTDSTSHDEDVAPAIAPAIAEPMAGAIGDETPPMAEPMAPAIEKGWQKDGSLRARTRAAPSPTPKDQEPAPGPAPSTTKNPARDRPPDHGAGAGADDLTIRQLEPHAILANLDPGEEPPL